jgi:hypothetical protein
LLFQHRLSLAVFLLTLGTAVFGFATGASALPAAYSGAEIRGWVVDAETKKPLEGVHVVAQWILRTGIFHGEHVIRLQILETVTDAKGEYYFPAWGPKARPPLSELEWGFDPILGFFKAGYKPDGRSNYSPPPADEAEMSRRFSVWHGKTIALEPFRGTAETWVTYLENIQISLGWGQETGGVVGTMNDYWKDMPRMVLAIVEQRNLLPGPLKHRVQELETWRVKEGQLRALIKEGGTTR